MAETYAARLTAFEVAGNGDLLNRRVWAGFDRTVYPDGICLDAEGAIWVASPSTRACLRVREGGEVVERIGFDRPAYACALGGDDGRTLFVCTAESHDPERQRRERNGCIEAFTVAVPSAR